MNIHDESLHNYYCMYSSESGLQPPKKSPELAVPRCNTMCIIYNHSN